MDYIDQKAVSTELVSDNTKFEIKKKLGNIQYIPIQNKIAISAGYTLYLYIQTKRDLDTYQ